jgi:hypothetical protein
MDLPETSAGCADPVNGGPGLAAKSGLWRLSTYSAKFDCKLCNLRKSVAEFLRWWAFFLSNFEPTIPAKFSGSARRKHPTTAPGIVLAMDVRFRRKVP